MEKILDGKKISQKLKKEVQEEIQKNISKKKRSPQLEILLVGKEYASEKYINMKKKLSEELGIQCNVTRFTKEIDEKSIIKDILDKNQNKNVDGIMVQLPLPKHLNTTRILEHISPQKDVDGLTSNNLGKLFTNNSNAFLPATPLGIIRILKEYKINLKGKHVVILGRSLIVGIPLVSELLKLNASVTIMHSKSKNIKKISSQADILISAIGKANIINSKYIKKNSILIDVGISQDPESKKICGDFHFSNVIKKSKYITPVPGGVGATTVPSLMKNVVKAWKNK